jgi:hypothetical protein
MLPIKPDYATIIASPSLAWFIISVDSLMLRAARMSSCGASSSESYGIFFVC